MIYGHARFLILTGENMTTPLRPLIIGGFRAGATVSLIEKKSEIVGIVVNINRAVGIF
jgi:hypothetical protein